MDEVVKKVAALGLPGTILVITMASTGLTGMAAIAAALAILGGPTGVLGGVGILGLTGLIAEYLTQENLDSLLTAIYRERAKSTSQETLEAEIDEWITSEELKTKLKWEITQINAHQANFTSSISAIASEAIQILDSVPGMLYASAGDIKSSRPIFTLRDETVVRTWKNPFGIDHVFLADPNGNIIYGGYTYWIHAQGLNQAISRIRSDLTA